ncbi:unnamed protein product [Zymoseptoria tritici ST99CH_3D7]|uniref:Uncharacterized protein n=1 Tax=Zymoseptoria tritici (strain ST99CH_3D7) TaxID=1276538 RepID=A0A1X7RGL1_ZYMT9|nr:unnamed protein product [Zymoseptoria tritici ST99CH_3D7]
MKMGDLYVTAGLTWAMPVRPDKLGANLMAFEQAVPELRALRLCHRFGKGPNVHITKLPAELELLVEGFCLEPRTGKGRRHRGHHAMDWEYDFRCFESRCSPLMHMHECSPLLDRVLDMFEYCDTCPGEDYTFENCATHCKNSKTTDLCGVCKSGDGRETCEKSCEGRMAEEQEQAAAECELWYELHMEGRNDWMEKLESKEVDKLNVILRQHFGLEARFSETRAYSQELVKWPEDRNHRWHDSNHRETTICHLTIPHATHEKDEWITSDAEDSFGTFQIEGTQSLTIDTNCQLGNVEVTRRFQKAMLYLGLEPEPHPSQTYCTLRPDVPTPALRTASNAVGPESEDQHGVRPVPKSEWPKLILMLKAKSKMF